MADKPLTVRFLGDSSQLAKTVDGIGSKFSGLKVAAAAGAAAAGGAISAGIAATIDTEAAQKKLQAQLGDANPLASKAGEVAGSLYSQAYGENLGEVNDAVRSVITSGALMANASSTQIEGITAGAMNLAQAFNLDVSESMRAVSQLVKTGLAPDATAAMDLITVSFQKFGPQAQDVLDTVTEYSTQFRKLGLDGPQAMGLIQQGLQAGARDTDTLADAIKEFSIRAVDGSTTTADGFKKLGLNADEMAKKFAQGGPVAQQAFDVVIDRLRAMKNPLEQQTAAVDLFGTKAEDLGAALFALDPSSAVNALGEVAGANSRLGDTMGDTAQNKITAMQRSWESWSMSLVASNGPIGTAAAGVFAFGQSALGIAGNLGMAAVAFGPFTGTVLSAAGSFAASTGSMLLSGASWAAGIAAQAASSAASMVVASGRMIASGAVWAASVVAQGAMAAASFAVTVAQMVAGWALLGAQSLIRAAQVAAAWVIAMGPIGWAIAAVVGLVALIIANWDQVKASTIGAWNAISGAVAGKVNEVIGWIAGIGGRAAGAIGNLAGTLYNSGVSLVSGFFEGIVSRWNQMVSWVRNGMANLRALFPFSPAKTGPFSGRGYVTYSGQALVDDFAASIAGGQPGVLNAVRGVLDTAQAGFSRPLATAASTAGAGAGGGGPVQAALQLAGGADQAVATLIMELIRTGKLQINV